MMNSAKVYRGTVRENSKIEEDVRLLELHIPGFDGIADAGQFVMVKVGENYDPLLRRPYSIFECGKESMKLLVKIVGKGSETIALKEKDSTIDFLGPLGTGFCIKEGHEHLLVGGGMGMAPMWYLAKKLEQRRIHCSIIFGERTHTKLGMRIEQEFTGTLLVTDDGSAGKKGFATDALCEILDREQSAKTTVYGCGPRPMLECLQKIAAQRSVPVFISLEERMACGVGVCLGCSVSKADGSGFINVCRDGPVFPAQEVRL